MLDNELLRYELHQHRTARNILYAFIAQGEVLYIGKSVQTLAGRMNGYKMPGVTQRTNIANNARIKATLGTGVPVQIIVFVAPEQFTYRDLSINLAAGLEDNLIARLLPPWNSMDMRADAASVA